MIDEIRSNSPQPSIPWRLRVLSVNEASSQATLLFANPTNLPVEIRGRVRGPLCEYATTLAAKYPLSRAAATDPRITSYLIDIPESCLWEPAHPFRYSINWNDGHCDVEIIFGFRVLTVQRSLLQLNGQNYRIRGISFSSAASPSLQTLHELGCNFLINTPNNLADAADQFGPLILGDLTGTLDDARAQLAAAGPLHPSIGVWRIGPSISQNDLLVLRGIDKTSLFAREIPGDTTDLELDGADLVLIWLDEAELSTDRTLTVPWLAIVRVRDNLSHLESCWEDTASRLDQATRHRTGCIGWVATES